MFVYVCTSAHAFSAAMFLAPSTETDPFCGIEAAFLWPCPGILSCQGSSVVKCYMGKRVSKCGLCWIVSK